MMKRPVAASVLGLAVATSTAMADIDAGRTEYMTACAGCHGESGLGQGPFAALLEVEIPGLTGLARANDGVFPFLETLKIVDGRTVLRGHGGPMPIWGDRFEAAAQVEVSGERAELIAHGRLLSLIEYLASIQQ